MGLFRLLARVTIGALFVGHGTQKLFGWFGGGGPEGTGKFFEELGLRPGAATRWQPGPRRPEAASASRSALRRRSPLPHFPAR